MEFVAERVEHTTEICAGSLVAVKDALYVLNGKWKLPLILALGSAQGYTARTGRYHTQNTIERVAGIGAE